MTICAELVDLSDRAAAIRTLQTQGLTVPAIARRLGVSRSRIYQVLAAEPMTAAERAACERFEMLPADLAARLASRFRDADAVCAAEDHELLSLRALGPRQLHKLRQRYPHRAGGNDDDPPSEDLAFVRA